MKMKKGLGSVILAGVLGFSAVSTLASTPAVKVEINGVSVYSPISYKEKKEKTMVDVDAFFNVMKTEYQYNQKKKTITYKDESIPVKKKSGGLVAEFEDLANLIDANSTKTKEDGTKYALVLPEGVDKISESVPKMGEHWADLKKDVLVYGDNETHRDKDGQPVPIFKTIYGVHDGELVFIEQMIAQSYMEGKNARSWVNLEGMRGLPSPSVVQTDIEFQPGGHEGYLIPHYDFHHYFISDEEQQAIGGVEGH
jgi:hypothetical protein